MLSTDNLIQNSQAATAAKAESLTRLYLKDNFAEISKATIAQFCDWLWEEFQNAPLNLAFSWYERGVKQRKWRFTRFTLAKWLDERLKAQQPVAVKLGITASLVRSANITKG